MTRRTHFSVLAEWRDAGKAVAKGSAEVKQVGSFAWRKPSEDRARDKRGRIEAASDFLKRLGFTLVVLALASCRTLPSANAPLAPRTAYHQHLISPATAALLDGPVIDGAALLKMLDDAGIRRGVVLSMAYTYADERKHVADPDRRVREENDWTAGQIAGSHGRLKGFCSVNPLRDAALAEFERCSRLPGMLGLKLHFGNSGVDLRDPAHLARVKRMFAAANARHAAIVVHMRSRTTTPYGAEFGRLFLDELLPAAPDVVVQVAHLAGSGGYADDADAVMGVFAEAFARHDPRTRNLYFDVATNVLPDTSQADLERIAGRIRQVGLRRILFGSDLPVLGNLTAGQSWAVFRARLPLTEAEFRQIAANRAPYMPR
jgi:predicted TIM-barrel fold metal-dependent hydrolase